MKRILATLLLSVVPIAGYGDSHAKLIRVPSDQPTIQAGIDFAASGDTVQIAPGIYSPPAGAEVWLRCNNKGLSLEGVGGSASVILQDNAGCQILTCVSDRPVTMRIHGLTFAGAHPKSLINGIYGAALLATTSGGALDLTDCRFSSNGPISTYGPAGNGGALYAVDTAVRIDNCQFESNSVPQSAAHSDGFGGAIGFRGSSVHISNSTFRNNSADGGSASGGVGGDVAADGGSLDVEECRFEGSAANYGGSIYATGLTSISVRDCEFEGIQAGGWVHGFSVPGGVLRLDGSSISIAGCTLSHCSLRYQPAPLIDARGGTVTVERNTLARNSGLSSVLDFPAGGITSLLVLQNVIAGNDGVGIREGTFAPEDLRCNLFWGIDSDAPAPDGILDANGNIHADPLFCTGSSGEFSVAANSPCLVGQGPHDPGCGAIGAWGAGCAGVSVQATTWSSIKARYGP